MKTAKMILIVMVLTGAGSAFACDKNLPRTTSTLVTSTTSPYNADDILNPRPVQPPTSTEPGATY